MRDERKMAAYGKLNPHKFSRAVIFPAKCYSDGSFKNITVQQEIYWFISRIHKTGTVLKLAQNSWREVPFIHILVFFKLSPIPGDFIEHIYAVFLAAA